MTALETFLLGALENLSATERHVKELDADVKEAKTQSFNAEKKCCAFKWESAVLWSKSQTLLTRVSELKCHFAQLVVADPSVESKTVVALNAHVVAL